MSKQQIESQRVAEVPVSEQIEGEIYVSLPKKALGLRGVLLLTMLGSAGASAALAGYLQTQSVQGGNYSKADTQCPGVSPAQKAATLAPKH